MAEHIILVDSAKSWPEGLPDLQVVPVRAYLTDPAWSERRGVRAVNLCRDMHYHSAGYYASLLAEARGHRVLPSVRTIQDLSRKALYLGEVESLDRRTQSALDRRVPEGSAGTELEVFLVFGESDDPDLQPLARALFDTFPAPLLRVEFRRREDWRIAAIRTAGLARLPAPMQPFFSDVLSRSLRRPWRRPRAPSTGRWEIAVLHDPEEEMPPSDRGALAAFIRAARREGLTARLITRRDFGRLAEFDALYIRETTNVNHHTWRFARKAEAEGLVVIDDPDSILRCTNKIYLAELLARARIGTPKSVIVSRDELDRAEAALGYPMILKVPDGAFSRGVFKVADRAELERRTAPLFEHSDLLLAQAWTYTPFDWRIGILAGEALFACRYHMSRGHWQILHHGAPAGDREGAVDTLPVDDVPATVIATARRAAALIGDGLYGVDLKETPEGVKVIEVNDNPNIDAGVEDRVLGDELHRRLVREFVRRLERRTRGGALNR
ncbi:RimK family protein [Gaopeijia maritima]|uniref:RimK family protein n=1 Tax=Gaopeijia maritima TaxID=3119007 RepID=A0ABU9EAU2_9BACT